ncbi:fibronectin type III domain-containing protein [Streptosporangium longisporum]|uniref:Fibronectin type-III domain-containing protein n=1 Tax=Streptosporangium longisporum TaxID=46187 RepID=A0ABP6KYZ7_9ACTN
MAVTEVLMGLGSWGVQLSEETPREVLDRLQFFSHLALVPGRVTVAEYQDELLSMARYVGVLTGRESERRKAIRGQGMAVWLGDSDDKGEVLETAVQVNGATFPNAIRALLGSSTAVVEGVLHSAAGTYTGRHQWQSRRQAIDYVCSTMGCDWRVNGNGTLDAGPPASLFKTTPTCVIVREGAAGPDMALTGLPGDMALARDVEDWTSRVVLLAEGEGASVATAAVSILSNPYLDLRGQPVRRTRLVSESGTATGNAQARAQLQLNRFSGTRDAMRLSAADYDIRGAFVPGDWVWVYDPDSGLYDTDNEIIYRGQRINPIRLRAVESSWPVAQGMTVACRHQDGTWMDLTPHVLWESGATSVVVGELHRALTSGGEPVGPRPIPDATVPGTVSWLLPFQTGVYLDALGGTRATIQLSWDEPLNADGSTVLDGDHYEIRYDVSPATGWRTAYAAWGDTQTVIGDLSPGVAYDFQIRAIDMSGNAGEWSVTETATAHPDTIPPSTPAAPVVAGSSLALQVRHELGKATGGTHNLELDLSHLEIHVGDTAGFSADETTLKGQMAATAGMMQAEIAAVGTVEVAETTTRWVRVIAVDMAGNRSAASAAASATALLVDSAHISDLTVSKVTAGTISSNWLIGASIRTASSGQRVELNATGLHGYNGGGIELVSLLNDGSFTLRTAASGARIELDATTGFRAFNSSSAQTVSITPNGTFTLQTAASGSRVVLDAAGIRAYSSGTTETVNIEAASGTATLTGEVRSAAAGRRIVVNPHGSTDPQIKFYPSSGTNETTISAPPSFSNEAELRIRTGVGLNSRRGELFLGSGFCYLRNGDGPIPEARLMLSELGHFDLGAKTGTVNASGGDVTVSSSHNAFVTGQNVHLVGGGVHLRGRLGVGNSDSAVVAGKVATSGTGGTVFYGVTYSGTPYPAVAVRSGNNAAFNLGGVGPSSFSWSWGGPGLSAGADHINWFGKVE